MSDLEIRQIVAQCKYPDYSLEAVECNGMTFIRAKYSEADTVTGKMERQQTRQWVVETTDDASAIVRTCFKCILTSMEHRTREWFTYKGAAILQPHFDVDELVEASK